MVEGVKIVNDLLSGNLGTIDTIIAIPEWLTANEQYLNDDFETISCTEQELASISSLKTPNEVLAVIEMPQPTEIIDIAATELCLYLDAVRDPGNLGTIIRTADWFGVNHVFLSPDCVDVFNPKVIQASMSSVLRVKCIYTGRKEVIENASLLVMATSLDGQDLTQSTLPKAGLIVMGNESKGVDETLQDRANLKLRIPGNDRLGADSLNVAVATGIVLSYIERGS